MMLKANAPLILGISQPNHNGAACLLSGDEIVVSVQEERLNRLKRSTIRDPGKSLAVKYCLDYAGIGVEDLDLIVLCPMGENRAHQRMPSGSPPVLTVSHHLGHAIGVFATSGFDEAAILIVDGCGYPLSDLSKSERGQIKPCVYPKSCFGEPREVITIYKASDTECIPIEKHVGFVMDFNQTQRMPDFGSLGGIFNSAAHQMFGNITDAGKVMGLASYGRPRFSPKQILSINQDGCFEFYDTIPKLFAHTDRWPQHKDAYEDLAHCVQESLEVALRYLVDHTRNLVPVDNFCYAGGVALNGVANERVVYKSDFKDIYIMPAAEDSGGAIGAAYYGLWKLTGKNTFRKLKNDCLGRSYPQTEIIHTISETPGVEIVPTNRDALDAVAESLTTGAVVGWFRAGSELGPRALGYRSILCDPRRPDAKEHLNARVKHREAFRPFALAVLLEEAENWFEIETTDNTSPFMLRVYRFRKELQERVPAVCHVDHSGRVQTVCKSENGAFYELIKRFYRKTGVPMILNTSFNVMGEPIVECPDDALWCLLYTGVDLCVLEDTIVRKRTDYDSVLSLTPKLALSDLTIKYKSVPGGGPLNFKLGEADELTAGSVNRWGFLSTVLTGPAIAVLGAIDGKKNGWELLKVLKRSDNLNESQLITALGQLRRASCISFSDAGESARSTMI